MIALIDADSLVYIIASNFKETPDRQSLEVYTQIKTACRSLLNSICTFSHATAYLGTFSAPQNFRHREYKYRKYKGNRPERPDWFKELEPIIKNEFTIQHKFITPVDLEADDIVSALTYMITEETVICSIDKDLDQVPGKRYNYQTEGMPVEEISAEDAERKLWIQILSGDSGDNIVGIPKMGVVKAGALIDAIEHPILRGTSVINEFMRYYDEYYGPEIYRQTRDAVELINPAHNKYPNYKEQLEKIIKECIVKLPEQQSVFS